MVFVQEDEELQENVIYYLSRNLIDAEICYSHVEKLALATVHAAQRLRHYILLRQTLVVAHVNPFQLVLTRRMIQLEEISTQNGPFNFYSNSMSSCVSQ